MKLRLPSTARAILLKLESRAFECADDTVSALRAFEEAARLGRTDGVEISDVQQHIHLLRALVHDAELDMPATVRKAMRQKLAGLVGALLKRGPWQRADQLPATFVPDLAARPWWDAEAHARELPFLAQALRVLRQSRALLVRKALVPQARDSVLGCSVGCPVPQYVALRGAALNYAVAAGRMLQHLAPCRKACCTMLHHAAPRGTALHHASTTSCAMLHWVARRCNRWRSTPRLRADPCSSASTSASDRRATSGTATSSSPCAQRALRCNM